MSINVGVFFGGVSVEHEISVISACQAMANFNPEKYNIVPLYITKEGTIYTGSPLLDIRNYEDMDRLLSMCMPVAIARKDGKVAVLKNPPKIFAKNTLATLDVAFPVVHGTNCEDGTLQGFCEMLRLPYAGPNILASAAGMDKVAMKHLLAARGIPVVPFTDFSFRAYSSDPDAILDHIEGALGYPVIVKPSNLGSSVGISRADDRAALAEAIELAGSFATHLLVEHAVTSLREINCAVVGDYRGAEPSPCEEPITAAEILSYNDKYVSGGNKGMSTAKRKLPADLAPETEETVKSLAVRTFQALGCAGCSRIDFLLDTADGDRVYVNEINTIPGSLAFYLWEAAGVKYEALIDTLIELAFSRERERGQLVFTYEKNIFSLQGTGGIKGIKGGAKGGFGGLKGIKK